MIRKISVVLFVLFTTLCLGVVAGKVPWQRRIAGKVVENHKFAHDHVELEMWPEEPSAPKVVDPSRFKNALATLCGPMPENRLNVFTESLLEQGGDFGVDPFLMAALVYDRSGCRPRTPDREVTHGVTRIDIKMHSPHIRGGEYRYFVKQDSAWNPKVLDVSEYPFNKWKAEKIKSNLYFAAAILKVFTEQCDDLDDTFKNVPHRHPVSHWFYGDRVKSTGPEDRVLTVRRRFLAYYNQEGPIEAGKFQEVKIVSPLDGVPRLVLDYFKNKRGKKGVYGHRGIDLDGATGEPVRAIAAGRVTFSGVDVPGQGSSRQLKPGEGIQIPNREMGPGGLYVHVNHGGGLGSIYMHLNSLAVSTGEEVEAGHIIGTLGRSGTVQSGPHLHLEIRTGTDRVDPAEVLSKVLVDPFSFDKE